MLRLQMLLVASVCFGLGALLPGDTNARSSVEGVILTSRTMPRSLGSFRTTIKTGGAALAAMGAMDAATMRAHGAQTAAVSILQAASKSNNVQIVMDGVARYTATTGAHWILRKDESLMKETREHLVPLRLGDEAYTFTVRPSGNKDQAMEVGWRRGRDVGLLTVQFTGKANSEIVLGLARIIDGKVSRTG